MSVIYKYLHKLLKINNQATKADYNTKYTAIGSNEESKKLELVNSKSDYII